MLLPALWALMGVVVMGLLVMMRRRLKMEVRVEMGLQWKMVLPVEMGL